ncbi:SDR family oxidoreductase [Pseudoxanthomonas putridarboris]|uniref:SDR family oxidoreductase n=1 Tax=Pseudoxanthomonas putridarboris TaxID=752605 RepID=A0ABU9J1R3_9GAMM
MSWNASDIPDQRGRLAVVTGATGGIGYETALALAGAGAEVVLAGRSDAKGDVALRGILARHPRAQVRYMHLDLCSLASVRAFAERFADAHGRLDLLVNNAGVMTPPTRQETEDGFELQFGSNYLAHFALTARLLPLLRNGSRPRVVSVASGAHRLQAAIHFEDLQWQRGYMPWPAYAQSKLAMLLFAFELQRRGDRYGWGLLSNAAHPGFARTGLQSAGADLGRIGDRTTLNERMTRWMAPWASQSAAEGALPTLFAATSPQAKPAGYYGPQRMFEMKGPVGEATIGRRARDEEVAARLWKVSAELAGVRWPLDKEAQP